MQDWRVYENPTIHREGDILSGMAAPGGGGRTPRSVIQWWVGVGHEIGRVIGMLAQGGYSVAFILPWVVGREWPPLPQGARKEIFVKCFFVVRVNKNASDLISGQISGETFDRFSQSNNRYLYRKMGLSYYFFINAQ